MDKPSLPRRQTDLDDPMDCTKPRSVLLKGLSRACVATGELELGTLTGFSALAWYEGTKTSNVEIVSFDVRSAVLETTSDFFKERVVAHRITLVGFSAAKTFVQPTEGPLQHQILTAWLF